MSTPWVLGQIRFGEALSAAALTVLSSLLAFAVFAFLIPFPDLGWVSALDIMLALAGFVTAVPLRRRGASLASVLAGVTVTAASELVVLWLSASQDIRALGGPDLFALIIPTAAASLGVLAAFRVVPAAPPDRRWNRMSLW
jgi:hypothetical protein